MKGSPGRACGQASFRVALFLACVLCWLSGAAWCQAATQQLLIDQPRLEISEDILLFHCSVSTDEAGSLTGLLKDGAVLELTIDLTLDRKRSWWANAEVSQRVFSSVLRHDPLTRDFIATSLSHPADDFTRDRNLTRLLHSAWGEITLPVAPMQAIEDQGEDREYIVTAQFRVRHTEVPPWLQNAAVFWSSEVIPTTTVSLEFNY